MDSNQRYASPYHLPRSQRRPYHQKAALSAFCTLLEVRPLIWRGRRTPIPRCAGRFHGRRSESRHEIRFRSMPRSLIPVMTPHGSLRLDQADDDFVLEGGLRLAAPVGVVAGFRHALHRRPLRAWRCEGARRPNGACRADVKPTPRLSPATVEPRPIGKLAKRERDEGPKPQPSRE